MYLKFEYFRAKGIKIDCIKLKDLSGERRSAIKILR